MNNATLTRFRLLASTLSLLLVLAVVGAGWFYWQLRRSLPLMDGVRTLPGLTTEVRIERDAQGVPVIRAGNRADLARATGFVHAQDRFFQMDLLRRRGAGELAELLGKNAVPLDREARIHRFRAVAQVVLAHATPEERALLDAYTAGVNAGLAALDQKPWEYIVLRMDPVPWKAEDSVLVSYAMALDLQAGELRYKHALSLIADRLGGAVVSFLAPAGTEWDAALDGSTLPAATIPTRNLIDLRRPAVAAVTTRCPPFAAAHDELYPGSNAFAVGGNLTASGAPLLADDMHLALGVPDTWYRASLVWRDAAGAEHRVTGVTLPGTPAVIAGSNGHVSWGFTNACISTCDLLVCSLDRVEREMYQVPEGWAVFDHPIEYIRVRGALAVPLPWRISIWGPVVGTDFDNRPLALHWTMDDPDATNFGLLGMETATDVHAAMAVAQRSGITPQNCLIADSQGTIAWTIAGKIPKRVGSSGRLPASWAYGDRRWDGWLAPQDVPAVIIPGEGKTAGGDTLWSANQRMLGGEALAKLGNGGYDLGARAGQIRDDLSHLEHAKPADLLAVQLDDHAKFLARWQQLLLTVLTPSATGENKKRTELRTLVESWGGRAAVDSAGYRCVRAFRLHVADRVLTPILQPCFDADDTFIAVEQLYAGPSSTRLPYEGPLWTLLQAKPFHLLDPRYASWGELLLAAADDTIADADHDGTLLARDTWGRVNTAAIRHPFSHLLPGPLARILDMPAQPLPGDNDMPRVQGPDFGASERFVVSPGHEEEGIFEMPGGVSANPVSPFYRAGHDAWVKGTATPFLPGPAKYTLVLQPQ